MNMIMYGGAPVGSRTRRNRTAEVGYFRVVLRPSCHSPKSTSPPFDPPCNAPPPSLTLGSARPAQPRAVQRRPLTLPPFRRARQAGGLSPLQKTPKTKTLSLTYLPT